MAPRITVMDAFPYTETVLALQATDARLYGAVCTQGKGLETHNVVDRPEDRDEAEVDLRQVNINRNRAFDAYMDFIREGTCQSGL